MGEFWMFAAIPFAVGVLAGAIVPLWTSRKRFPLIVAACASAFVVCSIVFVWDWHYRLTHLNPDRVNSLPVVLQSLLATIMYSPGICVVSAILGAAGAALIELCKADLRKRSQHDPRP
jgi:ribose/xylose/arabinose/galactoside ABC-type transport system permease subunit